MDQGDVEDLMLKVFKHVAVSGSVTESQTWRKEEEAHSVSESVVWDISELLTVPPSCQVGELILHPPSRGKLLSDRMCLRTPQLPPPTHHHY